MLFGLVVVGAAIWALWFWAARLLHARPDRRRVITGVLLGVTLGAGVPLLVAVARVVAALVGAASMDASLESTLLAEAISRGLNAVALAAVVTAAGAAVFGVLALQRRRPRE